MSTQETEADQQDSHLIQVADKGLNFRSIHLSDPTPTGSQLAHAAGVRPADGAIVLHVLADGALEDIRPEEVVDLSKSQRRFIIEKSDRSYRYEVEEQRFDWPCQVISGAQVRILADVPSEKGLYLERADEPDQLIGETEFVNLDGPGIESFRIRKKVWRLNVQGVKLDVETPTIKTRDAIERAGLSPDKPWHIFLKVAGQPKQEINLDYEIDLRTPGIEKVRLTAKNVNNGEAPPKQARRAFALLETDHTFLDRLGLRWETVEVDQRRWLLIHDYPVPDAFTVRTTLLALEIPPTYPGAQIYGFYAYPPLRLTDGREIPNTQLRGTIDGHEFHGWSRRPSTAWNPANDNVATQIALVEASLMTAAGE